MSLVPILTTFTSMAIWVCKGLVGPTRAVCGQSITYMFAVRNRAWCKKMMGWGRGSTQQDVHKFTTSAMSAKCNIMTLYVFCVLLVIVWKGITPWHHPSKLIVPRASLANPSVNISQMPVLTTPKLAPCHPDIIINWHSQQPLCFSR